MSDEQKPGDPADRAADGAFGGVQSHRAGYGDDKLARVIGWLRAHPSATLASGEGALLLGEIDRLNAQVVAQADLLDLAAGWADWAKGEMERLRRILATLREPSKAILHEMTETWIATPWGANHWQAAIRAAVAAAEQEVGRE